MAQIKLAEYTFDNNVGDCLPTLTPSTITMTNEDTVSGTTTRRIVYVDSEKTITKISFYQKSSLLTLDYLKIDENINDMSGMFQSCSNVTTINASGWNTSRVTNMGYLFLACPKLTTIQGLNTWDTSQVQYLNQLFTQCPLISDVSGILNWNVSNCKSFAYMFAQAHALTGELDLTKWNPINLESTQNMFASSKLTSVNLSGWNVPKLNNMNSMFLGHTAHLIEFINMSNWTMGTPANMSSAFKDCQKLIDINFTGAKLIPSIMQDTFKNCLLLTSLDLSLWDTSQCTSMSGTFGGCKATTINLKNWNTSKVVNMDGMFRDTTNLKNLDVLSFDTSNVTAYGYFISNTGLSHLDLSSFKTKKGINLTYLFLDSPSLESVDISNFDMTNMGAYVFRNSPKLKTIGMLYCSAESINKLVQSGFHNYKNGITIYYHDADPTQLTPVEGVTFKKYVMPTTIQLPPHIQLHSLPDGTKDEVDLETGILTRNVGEIVWNGDIVKWNTAHSFKVGDGHSQLSSISDWGTPNYNTLKTDYSMPENLTATNCLSENATMSRTFNGGLSFWGGTEWGVGKLAINIPIEFENLDEAKQWLNENPIVIKYARQTPTTEKLILNYNNSCDYGRILPTGICDKYDVVNSTYTQTMTSILLNGVNTWDDIQDLGTVLKFTATGTTVGVDNLNMKGAGGLYCDNDLFPNINDDSDVEHCRVDEEGNKFYIYVDKERLMSPDLIGWQIWLQTNPFNMWYELEEHLIYTKPYEELDPTQARWDTMDCVRGGSIKYNTHTEDKLTIYPTLEYVAPSINNFEVPMLEPNTEYTMYAEGIGEGDTINLGGTDIEFADGTVYTSGENKWLRIDNNDSFYNMIITKGDTTGEVVPYFEGMQSVKVPVLTTTNFIPMYSFLKDDGKENFTKLYTEFYEVTKDTFTFKQSGHYQRIGITTDSFEKEGKQTLERNKEYQFKIEVLENTLSIDMEIICNSKFTDGVKRIVGAGETPTYVFSKTIASEIPEDDVHGSGEMILFYLPSGYNGEVSFKVTIGDGNVNNIKTNILTVNEEVELRGIGDVKDELDLMTGEVVEHVGEIVLDGSQTLQPHSIVQGDTLMIKISDPSISFKQNSSLQESWDFSDMICDKELIAETPKWNANEWNEGYNIALISSASSNTYNINSFVLAIRKSYFNVQSIDEFKTWLTQNPLTIQYKLAKESIKTVDLKCVNQAGEVIDNLCAFENGTIKLSSDTGLLPTTHYTVPSTNTFHLPSMKTGTRYTLKYPSASGSIHIGDMTYKVTSPSMLFTTPLTISGDASAVVFTDSNPQDVMLIEGDYSKREMSFFERLRSSENIAITTTYGDLTNTVETGLTLRSLPNGLSDKFNFATGKLVRVADIRDYQEGDNTNKDVYTDGYKTVYPLTNPIETTVEIAKPVGYSDGVIELKSDALIPTFRYRLPSSNNFVLDLLKPSTKYTMYANYELDGNFTLGGTMGTIGNAKVVSTSDSLTDTNLTFSGSLGLSNVMLIEGDSTQVTTPKFNGLLSVENATVQLTGSPTEINRLTIPDTVKLRSIGSIIDELDLVTGVFTKRIERVKLIGSENWQLGSHQSTNYQSFKIDCADLKQVSLLDNMTCDRFKPLAWTTLTDKAFEFITGNGTIEINIHKNNLTTPDVDGFKRWLRDNPTTVHYELSRPVTKTLDLTWTTKPVTSYYGTTTVQSTSTDTQTLKPYFQIVVPITSLEEIVDALKEKNARLEEDNLATMIAVTEVFEVMLLLMPVNMAVSNQQGGGSYMVEVYVTLILKGKKTLEQVPAVIRPQVEQMLKDVDVL